MPMYDYKCGACDHTFEKIVKSDNRLDAEQEPCPKCGKHEIRYAILSTPKVSYGNPGSLKTSDSFNDRLKEIKAKVPERFKENLNKNIR